jgi:hypothetical protein
MTFGLKFIDRISSAPVHPSLNINFFVTLLMEKFYSQISGRGLKCFLLAPGLPGLPNYQVLHGGA